MDPIILTALLIQPADGDQYGILAVSTHALHSALEVKPAPSGDESERLVTFVPVKSADVKGRVLEINGVAGGEIKTGRRAHDPEGLWPNLDPGVMFNMFKRQAHHTAAAVIPVAALGEAQPGEDPLGPPGPPGPPADDQATGGITNDGGDPVVKQPDPPADPPKQKKERKARKNKLKVGYDLGAPVFVEEDPNTYVCDDIDVQYGDIEKIVAVRPNQIRVYGNPTALPRAILNIAGVRVHLNRKPKGYNRFTGVVTPEQFAEITNRPF